MRLQVARIIVQKVHGRTVHGRRLTDGQTMELNDIRPGGLAGPPAMERHAHIGDGGDVFIGAINNLTAERGVVRTKLLKNRY